MKDIIIDSNKSSSLFDWGSKQDELKGNIIETSDILLSKKVRIVKTIKSKVDEFRNKNLSFDINNFSRYLHAVLYCAS